MACLGAAAACVYMRARTQRSMETLLHAGTARLPASRGRARHRALGGACQPRVYTCSPRKFATPRVTRLIAGLLIMALPTAQQAIAQNLKRGEDLLTRSCASCHSIGRNGESPNKSAPAFRNLGQRYPIESLEEALGEGIMTGHPDMPEFTFDAKDVGAIIAYLKSIQQR
jgi:cytochrome c